MYHLQYQSPPLQLTDRAGDKFIGQALHLDIDSAVIQVILSLSTL
jgi:hypothetical protein